MVQKRKSSFSFKGKTSARAARDKKEGTSYGYLSLPKDVSVFSPEPGSSVKLDIIPYVVTTDTHPDKNERDGVALKGDPWYRYPYWRHTGLGSSGADSCVCLSTIKKKCPICEYRAKRIKQGAEKEETDALKASRRVLYNVIPIGHDKFEKKLHIFDISYFNFQNLLDDELRENDDNSVFPNLVGGLTLKTRFASKTIADSKPFSQASRIDFLEREKDYNESILDKVVNLDEILQIESYKQLQAKLFEMDLEGLEEGGVLEDIEEEENTPRRKGKKIKEEEPEEEEEDVDNEEEEDDEEEDEPRHKSKSKPSTKKRPVKEEEEDEDEDDDDDEEEEEPPRRKKPLDRKTDKKKKSKCPYGHTFGEDHDEFDDCGDCEVWDDCLEEKEG